MLRCLQQPRSQQQTSAREDHGQIFSPPLQQEKHDAREDHGTNPVHTLVTAYTVGTRMTVHTVVTVDGGARATHTVVTLDGGAQPATTTRAIHTVVTVNGGATAVKNNGHGQDNERIHM